MPFINYNGKYFDSEKELVTASSRGLRYGDGLFETMKMIKGTVIFEEDHLDRLWKGMEVLQFELHAHFSKAYVASVIKELTKKNNCEHAARIRVNIFRSSGGLYDPVNYFPNFTIEAVPLTTNTETLNSNGLMVGFYPDAFKSCDILSNLKHNNFLVYALAALYAKKEKWNDALVLNNHRRIADSTIANIFIVKNQEIFTPAIAEGCVAGIMRKNLMQFLQKSKCPVAEVALTREMISQADEVFFTNSIYDIRWVKQIENSVYGNSITKKIYTDFIPTIY